MLCLWADCLWELLLRDLCGRLSPRSLSDVLRCAKQWSLYLAAIKGAGPLLCQGPCTCFQAGSPCWAHLIHPDSTLLGFVNCCVESTWRDQLTILWLNQRNLWRRSGRWPRQQLHEPPACDTPFSHMSISSCKVPLHFSGLISSI